MSIPAHLLTRQVEVLRASITEDRYGNETSDWDNPTATPYVAWISPTGSAEDIADRDARSIDATLFLPSGADVNAGDRVRVIDENRTYDVIGPPMGFHTPSGLHHIEVKLSWREG